MQRWQKTTTTTLTRSCLPDLYCVFIEQGVGDHLNNVVDGNRNVGKLVIILEGGVHK